MTDDWQARQVQRLARLSVSRGVLPLDGADGAPADRFTDPAKFAAWLSGWERVLADDLDYPVRVDRAGRWQPIALGALGWVTDAELATFPWAAELLAAHPAWSHDDAAGRWVQAPPRGAPDMLIPQHYQVIDGRDTPPGRLAAEIAADEDQLALVAGFLCGRADGLLGGSDYQRRGHAQAAMLTWDLLAAWQAEAVAEGVPAAALAVAMTRVTSDVRPVFLLPPWPR
ncbi:MAG TPA: hypothetical protein VK741_25740 [Acetobacteraceae bacterium]|jgi:hypothetical protein|nr:hypothetical protein [Acetobacteraceae bacterium]